MLIDAISTTGLICVFAAGGAVIGSFIATAVVRASNQQTAWSGRSRCDHCAVSLNWLQTLPIVSTVTTGGRCHRCDGQIQPVHLAGELGGLAIGATTAAFAPWPHLPLIGALGFVLLALALIDFKTFRLPNALVLVVGFLAGTLAVLNGEAPLGIAAAVLVWCVLTLLQVFMARHLGRPALGSGDVKLCAALALWLSFGVVYALIVASVAALVVMLRDRRSDRLAFGPYIALGGYTVGIWLQHSGSSFWVP